MKFTKGIITFFLHCYWLYLRIVQRLLTLHTCSIGVALKSRRTDAHCAVIVDPTDGGLAALLRYAGIATLLSDACKLQRTFRVSHTFRPGC